MQNLILNSLLVHCLLYEHNTDNFVSIKQLEYLQSNKVTFDSEMCQWTVVKHMHTFKELPE